MHFGDSIFIFLLALVLFGPKKLPEIGRQVGKLLAEFRRASNEFKFQIQEEMRNLEEEDRRKKVAEREAEARAAEPAALPAETAPAGPTILPPSTGEPVSTSFGYSYPGPAEPGPAEPGPAEPGPGEPGPGEPNPAVQDATSSTELQVDPPAPTEFAVAPDVEISPELIPEPAAPGEIDAPSNGAHGATPVPAREPTQEPAPEQPHEIAAHHD